MVVIHQWFHTDQKKVGLFLEKTLKMIAEVKAVSKHESVKVYCKANVLM